jgi:uncharacterized C2H2 Zn-finger protein
MVTFVSSQFFKCPDPNCNCLFLNKSDLNKHLNTFGAVHGNKLKAEHQTMNNQYASCEWNEADKWQADTERRLKEAFALYKQQVRRF